MQNIIGIRQENIDPTEKRAPLTPKHVADLIRKHNLTVIVEPAANRIFPDEAYQKAGAKIAADLSPCNIIFGVKEVPISDFLPQKAYCFFSHTIKGQAHNMPMLKHILDLRVTLLDYEKVTNAAGQRIMFFGRYAGYAGMIDSLWALGKRLEWEEISTPFADIQQAMHYESLQQAREAISQIGETIASEGLPEAVTPFICGFAGYGQVSQGAQEIYDLLPTKEISPSQLADLVKQNTFSNRVCYKVVFKEEDMMQAKSPGNRFVLNDYYSYPEKYESVFESYLPYLTVLVNGIYWEPKYPRLVTKAGLRKLFQTEGKPRLRVIGDITCDIEGSIECTLKATNSANPIYVYDPFKETIQDGWQGNGLVVLAVDKLPSELPREASEAFGDALLPFVPQLAAVDFLRPFDQLELPDAFRNALIAHNGQLTPEYKYLKKFIKV